MFDRQLINRMTGELENFIRTHSDIYILPEVWKVEIFPLLKRLNANIKGILTNMPNLPQPNFIQTPSGDYPIVNAQTLLSQLNAQVGIIIFSAKSMPNPRFSPTFSIGEITLSIPAFALHEEDAQAIYDRLTVFQVLKQYQEDGVFAKDFKDISIRFARGMSTLLEPRHQNLKIQGWERRDFKIPAYDVDDAAIVMQGPIQYKDNYTITTAQLYREWYPNAPIIISTWKNEATENFRAECQKINVVLIESDPPEVSGALHVNYQIKSSHNGVEYVKQNTAARFAMKCRTDQRINRIDFIIYLRNLWWTFRPNGDKLNGRVITFGTSGVLPFFTCDFFYFGTVDDVEKIFSAPFQSEQAGKYFLRVAQRFHYVRELCANYNFSRSLVINPRKLRNYNLMVNKFEPPETFIMKSFCNNYVYPIVPENLLQIYWKFVRDYMIVVDMSDFLFDWPKYQNSGSYFSTPYYAHGIDHGRWLDIYLNYKNN